MLRLALAATLMYSATALTYEGDIMTLFSNYDTAIPASGTVCAANSDGTTGGPVTAATNHNGARPIVLGECYGTTGNTGAANEAVLPMAGQFGAASGTHESFILTDATEVKWGLNTAGNDVEMTAYTGTADDCTANAVTAESHGDLDSGWACRDSGSTGVTVITDSIATPANSAGGLVKNAKYVTVQNYSNGTQNTNDCATTVSTAAGQIIDYWPVAANDADAIVGNCATATTAATHTATEVACVAASADWTAGLTGNNTDHTKDHWALCYDDGTGSWQAQCDLETGDIIMTTDADSRHCGFTSNKVVHRFNKTNKGSLFDSGNKSMCIQNSDTEWDAICSFPAHTATAKYFKGYYLADAADCDTQTAAMSATAAENDGTRDVFIGVCYTLTDNGRMAGWEGPFVTGGAGAAPIASKLSYKFVEGTTDIELWTYTTHDCSGAAGESLVKYDTDDPASPTDTLLEWPCQNNSVISLGAVGTTGNISVLQPAINYLTVRRYTEASANGVGLPGKCTGGHATTKVNTVETSGLINDYFRVGTSAADGCNQMDDGTSAATVASAYSWWCDTTDGSINYGTFGTADCSASQLAGALRFTKKAYTTCTEADDADTAATCTAGGPTTTIENPSAFTFSAVTANADGAAANFGGKCLEQATNVSWKILTDDTTWDAICSVPTPAPATTTSTSGAGKVAATAAAAAAAAALLL